MGAILKGLGSVLIALGVIAIVGTGVILYYNNIAKPEEELVQNDPNAAQSAENVTQGTVAKPEPVGVDTSSETVTEPAPLEPAQPVIYAQPVVDQNSSNSNHTHDYVEEIVLPASCSSQGVKKRVCKICKDTITETIPQLNHTPGEPVTVKKPTTTETGLVQISCTVCGKLINSITLDAVEDPNKNSDGKDTNHKHNYTSEVTKLPTCTEQGERTYTCQSCGNSFTSKIPATNHPSRSTVVTEGDCKNPGKITTKCRECNATISETDLIADHVWGKWETTVQPTETTEGVQTNTCTVCGQTKTRTLDKLPSGSGASGTGGGQSECAHSWDDPTEQPATCAKEGYYEYTCTKCGETKTTTIPKTDIHKYPAGWDEVVSATATTPGYRAKYCEDCGNEWKEILPALGPNKCSSHNSDDLVIDMSQSTPPTSVSSGRYYLVCPKCGYTTTRLWKYNAS